MMKRILPKLTGIIAIIAVIAPGVALAQDPIRTDNLAGGVICEHYDGGRIYTKPNGDFAIYPQMESVRDDKTLALKDGKDIELFPGYGMKANEFRLTLPNGVILLGREDKTYIVLKTTDDGNHISTAMVLKHGEKSGPKLGPYDSYLYIPFKEFINPTNKTLYNIALTSEVDSCWYYEDGEQLDGFSVGIIRYERIETQPGASYDLGIIGFYGNDGKIQYEVGDEKLEPIAYETGAPGFLYHKGSWKDITDDRVTFTNGDYIVLKDRRSSYYDFSITLHDGTKVVYFPDVKRYKITYPNGDTYVSARFNEYNYSSKIDGNLIPGINRFELAGGVYKPFYTGVLTKANGKEYAYENGKSPQDLAAEEAQANQVYASLCKKYGKANVDNALKLNYTTGMSLEMLKEIGSMPIYDSESSIGTWYKVITDVSPNLEITYRWIHVNKSTGKIDYVGSARRTL